MYRQHRCARDRCRRGRAEDPRRGGQPCPQAADGTDEVAPDAAGGVRVAGVRERLVARLAEAGLRVARGAVLRPRSRDRAVACRKECRRMGFGCAHRYLNAGRGDRSTRCELSDHARNGFHMTRRAALPRMAGTAALHRRQRTMCLLESWFHVGDRDGVLRDERRQFQRRAGGRDPADLGHPRRVDVAGRAELLRVAGRAARGLRQREASVHVGQEVRQFVAGRLRQSGHPDRGETRVRERDVARRALGVHEVVPRLVRMAGKTPFRDSPLHVHPARAGCTVTFRALHLPAVVADHLGLVFRMFEIEVRNPGRRSGPVYPALPLAVVAAHARLGRRVVRGQIACRDPLVAADAEWE